MRDMCWFAKKSYNSFLKIALLYPHFEEGVAALLRVVDVHDGGVDGLPGGAPGQLPHAHAQATAVTLSVGEVVSDLRAQRHLLGADKRILYHFVEVMMKRVQVVFTFGVISRIFHHSIIDHNDIFIFITLTFFSLYARVFHWLSFLCRCFRNIFSANILISEVCGVTQI